MKMSLEILGFSSGDLDMVKGKAQMLSTQCLPRVRVAQAPRVAVMTAAIAKESCIMFVGV